MKKTKLLIDPLIVPIDINKLLFYGLTVEEFFICYIIYKNEKIQLKYYESNIQPINEETYRGLVDKGFLKIGVKGIQSQRSKNLVITDKFKDIFEKTNDQIIDDWIDDWIDLWPRGATSGGYYIRGDKRTSKHKMAMFRKSYPEYSKDIIFEATRRYLLKMAIDNFKYSKLSHYFILKDGNSTLASECDAVLHDGIGKKEESIIYGEDEL